MRKYGITGMSIFKSSNMTNIFVNKFEFQNFPINIITLHININITHFISSIFNNNAALDTNIIFDLMKET